jgi:hypothetical protein
MSERKKPYAPSTLPKVIPIVAGWVAFLILVNLFYKFGHEFGDSFEQWRGFPFAYSGWNDTLSPYPDWAIPANIAFGIVSTPILGLAVHWFASKPRRK